SLVEEMELAKSTCSRLLHALERNHLVRRDRDGAFRPGPLFTLYAARHDPVDDVVRIAEPTLERLGDALGETINLSVPRGDTVVQVAQVDSTYLLSATNWLDVASPPHTSALGKVFYAYGRLPMPDEPMERRTEHTLTSLAALESDLETVKRRGYAITNEELEPGLAAVAAPVRSGDGGVIAAVSVSGPTARLDDRIDHIAKLLITETRALSHLLGYRADKARKEAVA
ncbi:MAG: IclR family transcriptional regulator, partial [Micromonosporaceae bacterium]